MSIEFYGIQRAQKEGWMLIQDPPPINCRLTDREVYVKRLNEVRRLGGIIVGFRKSAGSRVWVFGIPPGEINLDWLKDRAKRAGMLLPETHPDFTYRWRGVEVTASELLLFHGDVMVYHLQQVCKYKPDIVSRRKAIMQEVSIWRHYREVVASQRA